MTNKSLLKRMIFRRPSYGPSYGPSSGQTISALTQTDQKSGQLSSLPFEFRSFLLRKNQIRNPHKTILPFHGFKSNFKTNEALNRRSVKTNSKTANILCSTKNHIIINHDHCISPPFVIWPQKYSKYNDQSKHKNEKIVIKIETGIYQTQSPLSLKVPQYYNIKSKDQESDHHRRHSTQYFRFNHQFGPILALDSGTHSTDFGGHDKQLIEDYQRERPTESTFSTFYH